MQNDKSKFKNKVYKVVVRIPRGEVLSYGEVARLTGHSRAWRAVGSALNKNPNPQIIPCHRVIKSDGAIGGYRYGTNKKISLLKKEGVTIKNKRVILNP